MENDKVFYIIAGCNGSGKKTAFRHHLSDRLGNPPFVNPDIIENKLILIPNGKSEVKQQEKPLLKFITIYQMD